MSLSDIDNKANEALALLTKRYISWFCHCEWENLRHHTSTVFVPFLVHPPLQEDMIPQHRLSSRLWLLVLPRKHTSVTSKQMSYLSKLKPLYRTSNKM